MIDLDPILLARIQFAFTVSFHIIFPSITIGLASFLAVLEALWLISANKAFKEIYKFWIKIFAITFGMGVVSGIVLSYEFGTNWSVFSDRVSAVIGPLLSYEVLTAFFLEASFLGIMLFGWDRVSKRVHFASTCIVAIGTLISAFWILAANSWMQTPQGFFIGDDGRLFPNNWIEVIFNPSFPYRFLHMTLASYLATAFIVGGVAAYHLLKKMNIPHAKIMLNMALLMALFATPIQILIGHRHGENTMEHQPIKVAAMEGNWDHKQSAPLILFGIPDQKDEITRYRLEIPGGASWILTGDTNGIVPALKEFPSDERPPVITVFWCFRVMVGIGCLMLLTGILSAIQYVRNKLYTSTYLQLLWILMIPSGVIAILAGWFVTEVGRQPWTVFGVLRTAHSASPAILSDQLAFSLSAFIMIYTFIFGSALYYITNLVKSGVTIAKDSEQYYQHGLEASLMESLPKKKGGKNV